MNHHRSRRIIGETPKNQGGIIAYATVSPNWLGECTIRYTLDGEARAARLTNYAVARTAAIRAIFADSRQFRNVVIDEVLPGDSGLPLFPNADSWFQSEHIEPSLAKAAG